MKRMTLILGIAMFILLSACASPAKWTSADVLDAFERAGLEVENVRPMEPTDYGLGPKLTTEGVRFYMPSMEKDPTGKETSGRILIFESAKDVAKTSSFYEDLGKENALFFTWVFTKDNVLLRLDRSVPEVHAREYEAILYNLGTDNPMPTRTSSQIPPTSTITPTHTPLPIEMQSPTETPIPTEATLELETVNDYEQLARNNRPIEAIPESAYLIDPIRDDFVAWLENKLRVESRGQYPESVEMIIFDNPFTRAPYVFAYGSYNAQGLDRCPVWVANTESWRAWSWTLDASFMTWNLPDFVDDLYLNVTVDEFEEYYCNVD